MTPREHPQETGLYHEIREALMARCGLALDRLRIDADPAGRVTIEGEVADWAERQSIADAVASVPGVAWVDCRLIVDN